MYIRFQVKSKIQNQAKMLRIVRRTCWNKYVDKLKLKLNERILPVCRTVSNNGSGSGLAIGGHKSVNR